MDGFVILCINKLFNSIQFNGWMDGLMDRWMDGWIDGLIDRCMDEWMDGWIG